MQLDNFIEGLNILAKHFERQSGHHIAAEHDQFFVYETDTPLSDAEVERLYELGWWQDEAEKAEDAKEDDDPPYDPESSWSAFT